MIGHIFEFNDVKLQDLGAVETVTTELISDELIWHEVSARPNWYHDRIFKLKEVTVGLRLIKDTFNHRTIEEEIDRIVASLYTKSKGLIKWNNKHSNAAFSHVSSKDILGHTAFLELVFINLDGMWYGAEKTASIGGGIQVNTLIPTKFVTIKLNPTMNDVEVKLGDKGLYLVMVQPGSELVIDLDKKTVKQSDKHVEMALHSDFFKLEQGNNEINLKNASGQITYREVVAL